MCLAHFNSPNSKSVKQMFNKLNLKDYQNEPGISNEREMYAQFYNSIFACVLFTTDTTYNKPRQSPSISDFRTHLTDNPYDLVFKKVAGKVFNKNLIASPFIDAVLKDSKKLETAHYAKTRPDSNNLTPICISIRPSCQYWLRLYEQKG